MIGLLEVYQMKGDSLTERSVKRCIPLGVLPEQDAQRDAGTRRHGDYVWTSSGGYRLCTCTHDLPPLLPAPVAAIFRGTVALVYHSTDSWSDSITAMDTLG